MEITVKELQELLKNQPSDNKVDFGGLDFLRLKDRGDITQFEFNQTIFKNEKGDIVIQNN
jgi:hypothetical protein